MDTVFLGDESLRALVSDDRENLLVSEFGVTVRLPTRVSAFLAAITQVVLYCAKEKMRWVHTVTNVATMANIKPLGNWAKSESPHDSMGAKFSSRTAKFPLAVSGVVQRAMPQPTELSLGVMRVELFTRRFHRKLRELIASTEAVVTILAKTAGSYWCFAWACHAHRLSPVKTRVCHNDSRGVYWPAMVPAPTSCQ